MPEQEQQQPAPSMDDYVSSRAPTEDAASPAPAPAPEETAASGTAEQPPATGDAAQPTPPQDENVKRARGVQKRIDELTRRAAEAERRADMLLQAQQALINQRIEPPQQLPAQHPADAPPREEDYQDYRSFLRDEARYFARKEAEAITMQQRQADMRRQQEMEHHYRQQQAMAQVHSTVSDFQKRTEEFAKEAPDYDSVVGNLESIEIGPHNAAMVQTLLLRPDSAKVLYHLGKAPQEAERISRLPPALQGAAIGEFAAGLRSAPQFSNAPPPGRPVGSRSSGVSSAAPEGSMDDYAAWRRKQG